MFEQVSICGRVLAGEARSMIPSKCTWWQSKLANRVWGAILGPTYPGDFGGSGPAPDCESQSHHESQDVDYDSPRGANLEDSSDDGSDEQGRNKMRRRGSAKPCLIDEATQMPGDGGMERGERGVGRVGYRFM